MTEGNSTPEIATLKIYENEKNSIPHGEYAAPQEIEIAQKGVKEFKIILAKNNIRQRWALIHGQNAQRIQLMFLGLKPTNRHRSGFNRTYKNYSISGKISPIQRFFI